MTTFSTCRICKWTMRAGRRAGARSETSEAARGATVADGGEKRVEGALEDEGVRAHAPLVDRAEDRDRAERAAVQDRRAGSEVRVRVGGGGAHVEGLAHAERARVAVGSARTAEVDEQHVEAEVVVGAGLREEGRPRLAPGREEEHAPAGA